MRKILAVLAIVFAFVGTAEARNFAYQEVSNPSPATFNNTTYSNFLGVSITTHGAPVRVEMFGLFRLDQSGDGANFMCQILRDTAVVIDGADNYHTPNTPQVQNYNNANQTPNYHLFYVDTPSAALHAYYLQCKNLQTGKDTEVDHILLYVEELN